MNYPDNTLEFLIKILTSKWQIESTPYRQLLETLGDKFVGLDAEYVSL